MRPTNPVSEQLAVQVAAYLAAGNSIEVLPGFEYKPLPPRPAAETINIEALKGREKQRALRMALVQQIRQLAPKHTLAEAAEIIGERRGRVADLACEFGIRFQRPSTPTPAQPPKATARQMQREQREKLIPIIRELATTNGITEVARQLELSRAVLARMATQHGIVFKHQGYKGSQARIDMRRAERLRPLAANGSTVSAMAKAIGVSRATVLRLLDRFHISRGPRMDLQP